MTMSILYNHLHVRKWCARWISHSLTYEQLKARVEWCEFMLQKWNSADRWWNLDLPMWSRNQDAVSGLAVSGQAPSPKTPKITQLTEENGCLLLRKIRPCRHHSSWGQTDCHCGLVQASLSPKGLQNLVPVLPEDGTLWPFSSSW